MANKHDRRASVYLPADSPHAAVLASAASHQNGDSSSGGGVPAAPPKGEVFYRKFPISAVAAAALSVPCEPSTDPILYEPRLHPRLSLDPVFSAHQRVIFAANVLRVNHRGRRAPMQLVVTPTHLLMFSEDGSLKRGAQLGEVTTLSVDNDSGRCLMTPTAPSGERQWLWEWDCAGVAATGLLGAFLQSRRALQPIAPFQLVWGKRVPPPEELQLRKTGKMKSLGLRRQEMVSITAEKLEQLAAAAAGNFARDRTAFGRVNVQDRVLVALEERRLVRLYACVIVGMCVGAHEAAFRCTLQGLHDEVAAIQSASTALEREMDAVKQTAAIAMSQYKSSLNLIRDKAFARRAAPAAMLPHAADGADDDGGFVATPARGYSTFTSQPPPDFLVCRDDADHGGGGGGGGGGHGLVPPTLPNFAEYAEDASANAASLASPPFFLPPPPQPPPGQTTTAAAAAAAAPQMQRHSGASPAGVRSARGTRPRPPAAAAAAVPAAAAADPLLAVAAAAASAGGGAPDASAAFSDEHHTLLLTRPGWGGGGFGGGGAAGAAAVLERVSRDFRGRGVEVAAVVWADELHVELCTAAEKTPIPLLVATALGMGYTPIAPTGAQVLLDIHEEDDSDEEDYRGGNVSGATLAASRTRSSRQVVRACGAETNVAKLLSVL